MEIALCKAPVTGIKSEGWQIDKTVHISATTKSNGTFRLSMSRAEAEKMVVRLNDALASIE